MKRAISLAAAGVMAVGLAAVPTAASASVVPPQRSETVTVLGSGNLGFVSRPVVDQGALTVRLRDHEIPSRDQGIQATIVRVHRGFTIGQVQRAINLQLNQNAPNAIAALSTRLINREAVAYGGIDALAGSDEVVSTTVHLDRPGRYWIINTANGRAQIIGTFRARHDVAVTPHRLQTPDATLIAGFHGLDRFFGANGTLPRAGELRVANLGDTIHVVEIYRVRNGVTDAQVQTEFNTIMAGHTPTSDPAGLNSTPRDLIGVDAISPGHVAEQVYDLDHGGTYLAVCFVADETTGVPHVFMGMHKILHFA
jgi:hypothetical protein